MSDKLKFILVCGPTATGKSALALHLAKQLNAPIINADSLQVYRKLDIGTAKPSIAERKLVPHYLFDICDPGEVFTAGDYRRATEETLISIKAQKHKFAVIVGGSGFYLQALEKGMFEFGKIPTEIRESLEADFAANGLAQLYSELKQRDPEYAAKISENDTYRIMRALEVIRFSNKPMTVIRAEFQGNPLDVEWLKMGISVPRDELRIRVRNRTQKMLEAGWIDEVQSLLNFKEWPPMKSVGYREVVEFLEGKIAYGDLIGEIETATMQLAKRQSTWFRRDPEIHWLMQPEVSFSALKLIEELD